jgi:hypothetical protein
VLGGDAYNGQRVRLAQARQLGKPLIAGEIGVEGRADATGACVTDAARAVDLRRKVRADLAAGFAGALVWDVQPDQPAGCSYELTPSDPYLASP